jgi:hypothetical protein
MNKMKEIVEQLESCGFQCGAGKLTMNAAFIELKRLANLEDERRAATNELLYTSVMLAARIGLSITAKRMKGDDKSADLEDKTFLQPWEKAAARVKSVMVAYDQADS